MAKLAILDTNPGGLAPAPAPRGLLDTAPHRNRGQGYAPPLDALPDNRLIAVWCSLGCPRWFAEQLRHDGYLRYRAVQVYFIVEKAAYGGHYTHPISGESIPARELVDSMRAEYEISRKIELVSDRPEHTIGLFER